MALTSAFLDDGLQTQHQMRVIADKLPDFIDEEDDAAAGPFRVEIALDPFAEILDRDRKFILRAFDPANAGLFALAKRFAQRLNDFILVKCIVALVALRPSVGSTARNALFASTMCPFLPLWHSPPQLSELQ